MLTLQELSEHPEKATQEDIRCFRESIRMFFESCEKVDYYKGTNGEKGVNIDTIAWTHYLDYTIYAEILNAFWGRETLSYADLNKYVFSRIDELCYNRLTIHQYYLYLQKLCWLGYIEKNDDASIEEEKIQYRLTKSGREALQQQVFANIAQSALTNIQANIANAKTIELNKSIRLLTIIAVLIASVGFIFSIVQFFCK